ncbi:MAG: hypothetical protein A4E30_00297 [Methanomassiliicoccales archaeon PtaB.Bin215]|nr:MAG: hypothetical protein A4E30_00297 [Methanomassiliicoccales archaeon PtaB.Bin215]
MNRPTIDAGEFHTPTVPDYRRIEDIMYELAQAREFSPLSSEQVYAWRGLTKNDPEEVQKLLDASPAYQANLRAQGLIR